MLRASGLFSMAVAALAATFDVGSLAAQNNASATVSATVQQPITVTKNSDLSFGNVFPGVDKSIAVTAKKADGSVKTFQALVRIDTPQEVLYYQHGGILQYVLRQLSGQK